MDELRLIECMKTLDKGLYTINTSRYGFELLIISDIWENFDGQEQEDESERDLHREYARYTASGSSYNFVEELQEWEMSAGGESYKIRVTPLPLGAPTTFNVAENYEVIINYTYLNNIYTNGSRNLFVNDILVNTSVIDTGDHNEDITSYLSLGLNNVRVEITDMEGEIGRLTFTINVDTVVLSSSFNDANVSIDQAFSIPFRVTTSATVRELHVKVADVEKPIRNLSSATGTEIISGLTHGVHSVEMYVIGRFLNAAGIELYNITSNTVKFNLIYCDSTIFDRLISSKFNIEEALQGTQLSIDYIVYDPTYELNDVELIIDGAIVNTLTVDSTRQYWSIKSLSAGTHTLEIKSGNNVVTKTIEITPLEIDLDVVKDDFLKLYLTAYGKRNTDTNKKYMDK